MRGFGWIGYVLAAGGLVGAGFAAARFVAAPSEAEPHVDVAMTVGSTAILVNSAFMVRRADRLGGRIDQLPLALDVKTGAPAGPPGPLGLREIEAAPGTLHVTLLARDEKLAPAERTARLYLRHLAPDASPSSGGLTRRAFTDASPYRSEDLHFTPPAGGLFAARCLRAEKPDEEPASQARAENERADNERASNSLRLPQACIADLRVGALDVRLRFPQSQLEDWEALTASATRFVTGLQAAAATRAAPVKSRKVD